MKKMCPICDARINGKYCKVCKKFVTPYEISDGAYINENHFQSDIPHVDCDYHNVKPTVKTTTKTYTPPTPNKPRETGKKKTSCSGFIVIIVLFIMLSSCIIPFISGIFNAISDDENDTNYEYSNEETKPDYWKDIEVREIGDIYEKVTDYEPVATEGSGYVAYGDGYFTVIAYIDDNDKVEEIVRTEDELTHIPQMLKETLIYITTCHSEYSDAYIDVMYKNIETTYEKEATWSKTEKNITYYGFANVIYSKDEEGQYDVRIKIIE